MADLHAAAGLIVGLGLLGTGLAYILYYYLVEKLGVISAASVTYLPPVVALLIGALIVGEPLGLADYAATGLILLGVVLLNRRPSTLPRAQHPAGENQQERQQEHEISGEPGERSDKNLIVYRLLQQAGLSHLRLPA